MNIKTNDGPVRDLSRNKDFRHKCDKCDTHIKEPGLCRECKSEEK